MVLFPPSFAYTTKVSRIAPCSFSVAAEKERKRFGRFLHPFFTYARDRDTDFFPSSVAAEGRGKGGPRAHLQVHTKRGPPLFSISLLHFGFPPFPLRLIPANPVMREPAQGR